MSDLCRYPAAVRGKPSHRGAISLREALHAYGELYGLRMGFPGSDGLAGRLDFSASAFIWFQ